MQGWRKRGKTDASDEIKTHLTEFIVTCRQAFTHIASTLGEAEKITHMLRTGLLPDTSDALDKLRTRQTLTDHALYLDEAIDIWTQRRVAAGKADGTIHGMSFTSDESPPSMNRFNGFRFQVTHIWFLRIFHQSVWEEPRYDADYPFTRERHLCDLKHCPDKTGAGTLVVIDSQMMSKGFSRFDAVSGTGDAGGENEGIQGIHALLEETNDAYSRRRCFGHLSWRISHNTKELTLYAKTLALNTYLHEGITWSRLQGIACHSIEDGGLNLVRENSREWHRLFHKEPPKMMDQRPECTLLFLEWLIPVHSTLAKLAAHDIRTRDLQDPNAAIAVATLQSARDQAWRYIDCVMLHKSLYLFYFAKDQEIIIATRNFDELISKAEEIIWSIAVDEYVLKICDVTMADLQDIGWTDRTKTTWVELCLLICEGWNKDMVADALRDAEEYRFALATAMVAYLAGTCKNIARQLWRATQLHKGILCFVKLHTGT